MKLLMFFSIALILAYSYQSASAQGSRGPGCPVISVSQLDLASRGSTHTYKAYVQNGDPSVTPKFKWTVSDGKITRGQGTAEVSVEVAGNDSSTVTVEVTGYEANCQNAASYALLVHRPTPRKFDEYLDLKFSEERRRLDQFAIQLHNEPGATGYILIYDAADTRKPVAQERGKRAKNYLVKECGLSDERIEFVNGGLRDKLSVELFITPAGALPPTNSPTRFRQ